MKLSRLLFIACIFSFPSSVFAACGDNAQLLALGYISVVDCGATPGNHSDDDLPGFQSAIDYAYQNGDRDSGGYAVYVPPGVYEVSNTIGLYRWRHGAQDKAPNILVGDHLSRPIIRLKGNAAGFDNPSQPRAVVEVQTFNDPDKTWPDTKPDNSPGADPFDVPANFVEQPGSTMYVDIRNLEIDLNDNAGAIGVYFPGAQHCTLINVKVDATGGYSGFFGLPGAGGGARNIEVVGGQYGITTKPVGSGSVVVGATLTGQTVAAIDYVALMPLVMVGFNITTAAPPAITTQIQWSSSGGVLTLVDGSIQLTGSPADVAIDNTLGKNLYLKNVYFVGADNGLLHSGSEPIVPANGAVTHVQEYSYNDQRYLQANPGDPFNDPDDAGDLDPLFEVGDDDFPTYRLVDGVISQAPEVMTVTAGTIPADLISRHLAPIHEYEGQGSSSVINVKAAPWNAAGDGSTDDRAAIQAAIDAAQPGQIVFLPRGRYMISNTLQLRSDTVLVGAGRQVALIDILDTWRPTSNATMLQTVDSASASTYVSFLSVMARHQFDSIPNGQEVEIVEGNDTFLYDWFTAFHWRAGPESSILGVDIDEDWNTNYWGTQDRDVVRFTGNSGGRHYFLTLHNSKFNSTHSQYRKLSINLAKHALAFYSLNAEHSISSHEIAITNSENVDIYGLKREGETKSLMIWNSHDIGVYGSGGMREQPNDAGYISLSGNSSDITVANMMVHLIHDADQNNFTVSEWFNGQLTQIQWPNNVSYFRRSKDSDRDGWVDAEDNCPDIANSSQADSNGVQDGYGEGDACEPLSVPVVDTASAVVSEDSVTISGAASDADGNLARVEVSIDGGASWQVASGTDAWTYTYTNLDNGEYSFAVRAIDALDLQSAPPVQDAFTIDVFEGACILASNWSHYKADRATWERYVGVFAVGSDNELGNILQSSAVRETSPGYWILEENGCN